MDINIKLSIIKKSVYIAAAVFFFFIFNAIFPIYALAIISSVDDDEKFTSILTYMWIPVHDLTSPDHLYRQYKMEDFLIMLSIDSTRKSIIRQLDLELDRRSINSILKYLSYHKIKGIGYVFDSYMPIKYESQLKKNMDSVIHEIKKLYGEISTNNNDISGINDDSREICIRTAMNKCYDEYGKKGLLKYIMKLFQVGSSKTLDDASDFIPSVEDGLTKLIDIMNDKEVKDKLAEIILNGIAIRLTCICIKYNIHPDFSCNKGCPNKVFNFITNTMANLFIGTGKVAFMLTNCHYLFDRMSLAGEDSAHCINPHSANDCSMLENNDRMYNLVADDGSRSTIPDSVISRQIREEGQECNIDLESPMDISMAGSLILIATGTVALTTGCCIRHCRKSNTIQKRINNNNKELAPLLRDMGD
ncbi:MAG: hypothetical protein QS721_00245 [Candidatus Endonucleobacter sp. (ex Gigantidas childressi)]|nr:hypothetical protein [Candidatus Endonucleobacter sp. (ex Gigantidas childressi)]